jgi:hypothetical protein
MSVYFEGNAFIDGGKVQNSSVLFADIQNSTVDMDMKNITSVADPVEPQDAATKQYVDDLGVRISNVTLIDDNYTPISTFQKGSFVITVTNLVDFAPTATFYVSKSHQTRHAHIVRHTCAPGIENGTVVVLEIKWEPNQGLALRKTSSPFNGLYQIKIV